MRPERAAATADPRRLGSPSSRSECQCWQESAAKGLRARRSTGCPPMPTALSRPVRSARSYDDSQRSGGSAAASAGVGGRQGRGMRQTALVCTGCPGNPAVEVYRGVPGAAAPPTQDVRVCVRCQDRPLKLPHPPDHLCSVCRRECPYCDRPTATGGICRACRRACLVCAQPLDHDGSDQWCGRCRMTRETGDPFLKVVSAFPGPLARACRYRYTTDVAREIHEQIRRHGVARIIDRMHRRWFERWARTPWNPMAFKASPLNWCVRVHARPAAKTASPTAATPALCASPAGADPPAPTADRRPKPPRNPLVAPVTMIRGGRPEKPATAPTTPPSNAPVTTRRRAPPLPGSDQDDDGTETTQCNTGKDPPTPNRPRSATSA